MDDGFSNLFYIMLIIGIIGVIGFLFIAAGSAIGADEPEPPISGTACIPVPPALDLRGCDKVFLPAISGGQ